MDLALRLSNALRRGRERWKKAGLQARASRRRTAFYCRALAGESDYNISVNCDMTVSCNCQDDGGAGTLGDLAAQSLDAIFDGPRARMFRHSLAAGLLPIDTCACCSELRGVSPEEAARKETDFHVPTKGIMVENNVTCQGGCLVCPRERILRTRKRTSMRLDDMRIVSRELKRHRIESVSYFKYGEPFMTPDILDELRVVRADNPDIRIVISTNGLCLNDRPRQEAALLADLIYFSLPGPTDAVVRRYQKGGSFQAAYDNMRALAACRATRQTARPTIEWKYVLFHWNDRKPLIERAIALAREAGVDILSFWPTTAPYHGTSWRYRAGGYCAKVGTPSWKGREVVFQS